MSADLIVAVVPPPSLPGWPDDGLIDTPSLFVPWNIEPSLGDATTGPPFGLIATSPAFSALALPNKANNPAVAPAANANPTPNGI